MSLLGTLALAACLVGQEGPSGPKVGTLLPGPFDCYNINGKFKGRQHDFVTDFGLRPTIMIFVRDVADDEKKEPALDELLKKVDEACDKHADRELRACVIFLSPLARSSATDTETTDAAKLVEEAKGREALLQRLGKKAEQVKNVLIGAFPEKGPPSYALSPKAAVTLLFYDRLKVLENAAYGDGQLSDQHIDAFMQKVREHFMPRTSSKKAKA